MAGPDPIGADRRARQSTRRLPDDAACAICGERNPAILKLVEASILERHEPGGRNNGREPSVVLCRNHHGIETMRQLAVGVDLADGFERSWLEKFVSVLLGIGAFLKSAGDALIDGARRLQTFLELLDAHFPAWRTLPGMH
jgi:hypothetical protein